MVYYIGYFGKETDLKNRYFALSAANKMEYIIQKINKTGEIVTIISTAQGIRNRYHGKEKRKIDTFNELIFFPSFGRENIVCKALSILTIQLSIFIFFLLNLKKNDQIIIYHSLSYIFLMTVLKKIKKTKFIIEVEELYSDITHSKSDRNKEMAFFKFADCFLFANENLNVLINSQNKPFTIIYGIYNINKKRKKVLFHDEKVHCVYAGTLSEEQQGAQNAIKSAQYLNKKYHIHILGFGTKHEINMILELINSTKKLSFCEITYDGLLSGGDFIDFIQSCDIGLNTRKISGNYNDTSFPSKILTYLVNGLNVVSSKINSVKQSEINDLITFYEGDEPVEIALAIANTSSEQSIGCKERIRDLDSKFENKINELLHDF